MLFFIFDFKRFSCVPASGQLNQINDDLGKLQKELKSCQGNIKTLNSKLTYDMWDATSAVCCVFCSLCLTFLCPFCRTHCNSQVLSQKQLCDERLAAAKLEYEKKLLKPAAELVRCFSLSTPSESKKRSENQTHLTFKPDLHSYTPPLLPVPFQESAPGAATKEEVKISTVASTMTNLSKPQVKEAAEILTNEITVGKGEDTKG